MTDQQPQPSRDRHLFTIATALIILALGIYRSFSLPETDTLWQVKAGLVNLSSGHIPTVEMWDWLVQGDAWTPNSWLWNVVVALAYQVGNLLGLAVLNFILFALLLGLAWHLLRQLRVNPVFQFVIIFLFAVVMVPWVTLRPQEIDYILLLAFFNLLLPLRHTVGARKLVWLGLLAFVTTILWMNFHLTATAALAFFPLGYLLLSPNLTWRSWRTHIAPVVVIVLATAAGLFVTPFGYQGVVQTLFVSGASRGLITEWGPLDFRTAIAPVALLGLIICGAAPVTFAVYKRKWVHAGVLLALTVTSYEVIRFIPYLIVFALLVTMFLPVAARLVRNGGSYLLVAAVICLLGVPNMVGAIAAPTSMLSVDPAAFKPIPAHSRVLTLPLAGGSMLLFRPDLSPAMDGRNDLFGRHLYEEIVDFYYGTPPATTLKWLNQQHVNAVYFKKVDPASALLPALRQAHWVEHDSSLAIVMVRPGA